VGHVLDPATRCVSYDVEDVINNRALRLHGSASL
jgi:hypothetical protein